jgi:glycosyltransferase involved in cell wall biosynthesis
MATTEPPSKKMGLQTLFLVWGAPHGSQRSAQIAELLGMDLKHIYITARQGKYYAVFKYVYQFFATLVYLFTHRYRLIFIQDPPIFAALPVYLYSLVSRTRFVIDAHTPPLLSPLWAWTLPLHRFLSRRAITTVVTNAYLKEFVEAWGGGATGFVLEDPPIHQEVGELPQLASDAALTVVMVSSASPDEPVREVLAAARQLPDVHFYITGDYARLRPRVLEEDMPANAHFTGYLREGFFPLLAAADVIMDLCVEEYQFLSGANEALWLGKPLITSKGSVLEGYFTRGTVHVDNTAGEIVQALEKIRDHRAEFAADMQSLQAIRGPEWWEKVNTLLALIQQQSDVENL